MKVLAGRYRVLRPLGQGAMGRVLLAEDRTLGRQVAVKVIAPEVSRVPGMMERLEREARLLSRVRHPSLVQVLDLARDSGGPLLVMEYVVGRTLEAELRAGPLSPERGLAVARELAGALTALHAAGILHRDLKPANVMLRDEDDAAVLMDLGLAVARGETRLTRTGELAGTPLYCAPEQLIGRQADPRSDQYQLGATLFRALTGRLLVPVTEDVDRALVAILEGDRGDLTGPRRLLGRALLGALLRSTALQPADRYPDLDAFVLALESASREPARDPPQRPGRRFGRGVWIGGALGIGLLLGHRLGRVPVAPPGEVRIEVRGEFLVASHLGPPRGDVRLWLDDAPVRVREVRREGRRTVLLGPRLEARSEPFAWLTWPGGQSARQEVRVRPSLLVRELRLSPHRRLGVWTRRPARLRVGDPGAPPVLASPGARALEIGALPPRVRLLADEGAGNQEFTVSREELVRKGQEDAADIPALEALATALRAGLSPSTRGPSGHTRAHWDRWGGWLPELLVDASSSPGRRRLWRAWQRSQLMTEIAGAIFHAPGVRARPPGLVGGQGTVPRPPGGAGVAVVRPAPGGHGPPEEGSPRVLVQGGPGDAFRWPEDAPRRGPVTLTARIGTHLLGHLVLAPGGPDQGAEVWLWPEVPGYHRPEEGTSLRAVTFPADLGPRPGQRARLSSRQLEYRELDRGAEERLEITGLWISWRR